MKSPTRRLRIEALFLVAVAVVISAMTADAMRPKAVPFKPQGGENPTIDPDVPLFLRSSADTCWVPVHPPFTSPCDPEDPWNTRNGITAEEVWCFEGAGGDSTWPMNPGENWNHWSHFTPPGALETKWHVTDRQTNPTGGGTYNAYVGCDSAASGTGDGFCPETCFWTYRRGYGNTWNYALSLDYVGGPFLDGGTITFDIRYDVECLYDYVYLEYLDQNTQEWQILTTEADGSGAPCLFNGVSGNPAEECLHNVPGALFDVLGNGVATEDDYGQSDWDADVTFPVPNISVMGGSGTHLDIRWRGYSDYGWSDADGGGDTDGLGAIDNVVITLPTSSTPVVISDDFESGDFAGLTATSGTATWTPGGLEGISYDSWHMLYDPVYGGAGNTCTFSDDWMWSLKPQTGFPPEANGFRMYLVSPSISVSGWTGGVVQCSMHICTPPARDDWANVRIRWYDTCGAWSQWHDADDGYWAGGCTRWNVNWPENLTPYLGASAESLQVAWEAYDISRPGDISWNRHGSVQFFVDNVSFGSFDGTATQFQARTIDIFTDTFSRVDPAHTSFLVNSKQGLWPGEAFDEFDSLTVQITDADGLTQVTPTNGRVNLWCRHDNGTGPHTATQTWTGWVGKDMDLSVPNPVVAGWGDYRMIFGEDSGVGLDAGGEDGTGASDGFIWNAGTTVQYYVRVIDDADNVATFPREAAEAEPSYYEFSILPFGVNTEGVKTALDGVGGETHLLVVDAYERNALDFEQSTGFVSGGGAGYGTFDDPIYTQSHLMLERALTRLYGGDAAPETFDPRWDRYDVTGASWSIRCEPRGQSSFPDIGGYGDDLGNPLYDALIWISGVDGYVFYDTTRIELANFLDRGGKLLSMGDDTVFDLAFEGNNTDSIIGFVRDYMGCDLPTSADDETVDRTLSTVGAAGAYLDGVTLGVYGECPIRRSFDRMALSTPQGGTNVVLMTYEGGDESDNGKASVIGCKRTSSDGVVVHSGFDLSTLLSDQARACYLDAVLTAPVAQYGFGLPATAFGDCVNSGVDVPVVSRFGYELAPASPNPFHATTAIRFSVPNRTRVSIEVYNVLGRKVRTLVNEVLEANSYVREWDGRADDGAKVSSGIYFYKMVADDFSRIHKTVLLR